MSVHRPLRFFAIFAAFALAASAAPPASALAVVQPSQSAQSPSGKAPSSDSHPSAQAPASQPALPTITFLKIFKSSTPEYVKIQIDQHGAGSYDIRQLDDQPAPQSCDVTAPLAAKIFALASDLHDFNGVQLEVRRRIANLGEKTFRYQNGAVFHQVSFNYTLNDDANKLQEIFEGLSLQFQYAQELKRSMRYDPLGLNDVLTRLQSDLRQGLLADPAGLVPILRQISSNQRFLDIARQRAEVIANSIAPNVGT